jgi:putative transposase
VLGRAAWSSTGRRYGLARVCRALWVPRSTVYVARARRLTPGAPLKRGPKTAWTDADLTEQIRGVLADSPFVGEGYRKAWARLRLAGVRTGMPRVLRLMRAANLLAPTRAGQPHRPAAHDGTIIPDRPDAMWGIDATAGWTEEGPATVFIAADHFTAECICIHAARRGTRFETLEPLRQGVRQHFHVYREEVTTGLALRHASSAARVRISIRGIAPGLHSDAAGRHGLAGFLPGW